MNVAGEADVVAPLKLTKYSSSLPIDHDIITSLLIVRIRTLLFTTMRWNLRNWGRVDVQTRVNLLPEHPMVKAKKYLST
jgi:hypothetical protein